MDFPQLDRRGSKTQAAFLQSRPIRGRFRLLSNEHQQDQEPESGKLPEPDQDRALETVIHDLRRILSANGEPMGMKLIPISSKGTSRSSKVMQKK